MHDNNPLALLGFFACSLVAGVGVIADVLLLFMRLSRNVSEAQRQRAELLAAYAVQHGWSFVPGPLELVPALAGFKLFNRGRGRQFGNGVSGSTASGQTVLLDYGFATGATQNRTWNEQTICAVRVPGAALPHGFFRRQEPVADAFGKLLGGQDLDFAEDRSFSQAWVVQTNGPEPQLRAFLGPAVRAHLLRLAPTSPATEIEFFGEWVLLHHGKLLDGAALDGLVADTAALATTLTGTPAGT